MIDLDRVGQTLFATFSSPSTLNALDAAMAADLENLSAILRTDEDLGLLVLQGEGRAFMAGGDINMFSGDPADVAIAIDAIMSSLNAFIEAVAAARCLVLASVHGAVAGGGLSIMLASDLILAAESTRFVFAYSKLGTSPDGGLSLVLTAMVGRLRAAELLLSSEPIGAALAARLGLINEVVPDADRQARTAELVDRIQNSSRLANSQTKALIRKTERSLLRDQLAAEKQSFLACAQGSDFKEGVAAFLEKRSPIFGAP